MCTKNVVKALIVDQQGQYLVQFRNNISTISFPGYWSLFRGAIENDEINSNK
jgi:hypothetical protein